MTRPRIGSVAWLVSEIGPIDRKILATVAQHRFVTRRQVEALHFNDRPSTLADARAARRALYRLVELDVLATLKRRIGGIRAGSSGLVYHLSAKGRRLYTLNSGRLLPRFAAEPSLTFLAHTLAVGDVHANLARQVSKGVIELVEFTTEPTCWRKYLNRGGGTDTLKPDAFAVTAARGAEYEDLWFIEVDRGTESLATVLKKARQYETYRRTGLEQQAQGIFPHVVWLTMDHMRAERITTTLARGLSADAGMQRAIQLDKFTEILTKEGGTI